MRHLPTNTPTGPAFTAALRHLRRPSATGSTTRKRALRVLLPAALVTALALGSGSTPPATASPDKDRAVITQTHVDAPVASYDAAAGALTVRGGGQDLDQIVLWAGATTSTGYDRVPKHLYRVGWQEALSFLGPPGTIYSVAPQDPGPGQDPIYAGIDSDYAIGEAAHDLAFEERLYTLDLVGLRGPGRMEVFTEAGGEVNRIFSSTDTRFRSVFFPRHSHMNTAFSKPGRYEVVYRTTARTQDGTLVPSKDRTLVWQMGGTFPNETTVKDVRQAFSATSTRLQGASLSLSPAGDDLNTRFSFDAGDPTATGALVILIDGYHLTEVPVVGGRATTTEALGSESSTYQAVFIPTGATGAWASQTTDYTTGQETLRVTAGADEILAPKISGQWVSAPDTVAVSQNRVEVTLDPSFGVRLNGLDPALKLGYKVETFSDSKGRKAPSCGVEGSASGQAQAEHPKDLSVCQDAKLIRVSLYPHPYSNLGSVVQDLKVDSLTAPVTMAVTMPQRTGGVQNVPDQDSAESPTPPAPHGPDDQPGEVPGGQDNPGQGDKPAPRPPLPEATPPQAGQLSKEPVVFDSGHLDLRLAEVAGKPALAIGADADRRTGLLHDPAAVTLEVGKRYRWTRSAKESDPSYDVIGKVGQTVYLLPAVQDSGSLWPGLSAEHIDLTPYGGGAELEVSLEQGPTGGKALFSRGGGLAAGFGTPLIDTSQTGPSLVPLPQGAHLHGAWVFTQEGTYRLRVRALRADNHEALAGPTTLTFQVGPNSSAPEGPQPAPDTDPNAPTPGLRVSASTVMAGEQITFTATGLDKNAQQEAVFEVRSRLQEVPATIADGVAKATWTVPEDFPAGNHTVSLKGHPELGQASFAVSARPAGAAPSKPDGNGASATTTPSTAAANGTAPGSTAAGGTATDGAASGAVSTGSGGTAGGSGGGLASTGVPLGLLVPACALVAGGVALRRRR
ncbi:putative ABC transporter-associated repeat protein [Actinomyces bovis]|uniref:ABC transporter-associated repeat protein n=1 Tax=Actinomyces bovis TaxID=1658 RepID=A0ABY1VKF5_9ACTO|nr:choice-of-anchor M domain-containing protein [Actinomyces bovis]SPT52570.1 putative ABC transporter-associated repeat protein [Actinomyces bovis]VEG54352.1 putative ABC transporter-associated repeat protein [Actinomyces israelii]